MYQTGGCKDIYKCLLTSDSGVVIHIYNMVVKQLLYLLLVHKYTKTIAKGWDVDILKPGTQIFLLEVKCLLRLPSARY